MRCLLLLALGLAGCADRNVDAGVRAFAEGRFRDAHAAFAAAEDARGDGAPAELLWNRALAALLAGEPRDAEVAAEAAAARGGSALYAQRDFLLGAAAYVRCDRAAAEAAMPEADPTAYVRALAFAAEARDAWQRAAARHDDWPEARRNVERASLRIAELAAQKGAADAARRARAERQPEAQPGTGEGQRDPNGRVQQIEQPLAPQVDAAAAELATLLSILEAKEREKRALRSTARAAQPGVEKDW